MDFDVVIVGGGPAGLSTAIHLANLIERHNAEVDAKGEGDKLEPEICLIEKAAELGAHSLSGAVMDPKALDQLLPDWRKMEPAAPVEADSNRVQWVEVGRIRPCAFQPRKDFSQESLQELAVPEEGDHARHDAPRDVQTAVGAVAQHEVPAGRAEQGTESLQSGHAKLVITL